MTASTAASSFSLGIVVASVGNRMTRRAGDRRRTPGTGDFRADIRFFADFLPRDLISQIVTRRASGHSLHRFNARSYAANTSRLLSVGIPGTFGETKTGGLIP